MAKTLFDHLNHIFEKQTIDYFDNLEESDRKAFSAYMIHRFVSMNSDYLPVVNEIQKYWGQLTNREVYLFYSQILPKKKQFNKYIKGTSDSGYEDWVRELVANHYQVSLKEAEDILQIYYTKSNGKQELRELLQGYGVDEKKLKKAGV